MKTCPNCKRTLQLFEFGKTYNGCTEWATCADCRSKLKKDKNKATLPISDKPLPKSVHEAKKLYPKPTKPEPKGPDACEICAFQFTSSKPAKRFLGHFICPRCRQAIHLFHDDPKMLAEAAKILAR